jgi:hypothetical protein
MRKFLFTRVPAFAIGAIAAVTVMVLAVDAGWLPGRAVPTVIADVPAMSEAQAEVHRDNHYASIASIEDLLALPGHFARMGGLYALAGRADSAATQDLIFQANGIADPSDRKEVLLVLFNRLTELDPASAVALSRTPGFRPDRDFEREVWQRWGVLDLDQAVSAALQLDPGPRRNVAAQALFAAYDYGGNATTRRIAEMLGTTPDSQTRAMYLDRLADRDPLAAIEYANGLESMQERLEAVAFLGRRFGRYDLQQAEDYAVHFDDRMQSVYMQSLVQSAAQAEPQVVLEELLEGGIDGTDEFSRSMSAFQVLARQDIEQALAYLEQIENRQQRLAFTGIVAKTFAEEDPDRALAWARENDDGLHRQVYMQVLMTIARTQPERAFSEANSLSNSQERRQAFGMVAMTLAREDPEQALSLLDRIERKSERDLAAMSIVSSWVQSAPDAAMSWVLRQDGPLRENMLSRAARWLPDHDLEAAIRLLPRMDDETAALLRRQIAGSLAAQRSLEDARRFISQFEGSKEYPQLLHAAISGLSQRDVRGAVQLAGTLPAGDERDALYSRLMGPYADEDPRQAALLLDSIANAGHRMAATSQLVAGWARADPEAAARWIRKLPQGQGRDSAVATLASSWQELTPTRRRMIEDVADPEVRKQTVMNVVFRKARSNPDEAERILRSFDLPDADREQMLHQLDALRERDLSIYPGHY